MSEELKPKELIEANAELIKKGRKTIENVLLLNREQILEFKNEKEFLDYIASIADDLLKFNLLVETMDELLIKMALKYLDKFVIDRFFGDDWFYKLQTWLKNIEVKVEG